MTPSHPDNLQDVQSGSAEANGALQAELEADDRAEWSAGLKQRLLLQLPALMTTIPADQLNEQSLRLELSRLAEEACDQNSWPLEVTEQERLAEQALTEFLGPIDALLGDHEISDIVINGPRQLFIEKRGQLQSTNLSFRNEAHLMLVIRRLLVGTGRRLDEKTPMLDARLKDGSRMNAVLKPPSLNGPLVSIRRLGSRPLTIDDLLAHESMTKEMVDFLAACVKSRVSFIISGGTGSGKTTLMNALSRYIPHTERIVTIEEAAELELQQSHVAKMEAHTAVTGGEGGVGMRELIRNSLRMRPDRIIVGECRGAEALEMLQAMNTGHEGSFTSIHSNTARDALTRIELMIGFAGLNLPVWAIRKLIASSVNLIIQVSRLPGGKRKIMTIAEITGMEGDTVSMHDIFNYVQTGVDKANVVEGYFQSTGIRPQCINKLRIRGAILPIELFAERHLQTQKNREPGR
jgi:pilus assembly protein CpaF